jgi:Domain of unknown function (DUF4371)
VLRYITDRTIIQERFYTFDIATDRSSSGLAHLLLQCLQQYAVTEKLISQTYDGASTMSGRLNGVQVIDKFSRKMRRVDFIV